MLDIAWLVAALALLLCLFVLLLWRRDRVQTLRQAAEKWQHELTVLRQELAQQDGERIDKLLAQLLALREVDDLRLLTLRDGLEGRLESLRESNAQSLEQIRQTVDEKLQQTLEQKLSRSYGTVSAGLEQVHKGLGEMQNLAAGVGDLKRVLLQVKNRGVWGEVQLSRLIEDMFTPTQYACNAAVNPTTNGRVEYAIILPGQESGRPVYLPIDAKFPLADYQLLLAAEEQADAAGAAEAAKALENRLKLCAKDIREKYICPPYTTDFAILFLPLEGLYHELLRRPAFVEQLQREYRVIPAGPLTLSAILNSLQLGFRSLAVEAKTGEVWQLLANIKASYAEYSQLLERAQKKLQEAGNSVEDAARKSRAIQRQLRAVGEIDDLAEKVGILDAGNQEEKHETG